MTEAVYTENAGAVIVGAGHAGVEAALACARMGIDTVLLTMNLDCVANMPCNPAIGGTGKGHLVYEIDALGGEMGFAADCVTLQSRTLNLGKGPAVHSKRVQADRAAYRTQMKHTLENQPGLRLVQGEVVALERNTGGHISAAVTRAGVRYNAGAVVICTGTYPDGRVIIGESCSASGPDGQLPSLGLSASLRDLGVTLMRFKTGTPPRIHRDSIDYSKLELQPGEDDPVCFSRRSGNGDIASQTQLPCYIAYTNSVTHEIIRANLGRSPLYSGIIDGVGPRYCPSIEDKVVRFPDKERHQLFLEPTGINTAEMYLQGFSSSMPADVQMKMLHSIEGFERAQVMRYAYAIEYDCADPTQLLPTLEFKDIPGLYGAGQFNGSSGYEEAAAQGLVAGINAALKLSDRPPMILPRSSSYIGTLIDDLVTKGTNEPYRIMTSRSEYRLLLRQDNAEARLTPYGRSAGLIDDRRMAEFIESERIISDEIARLNSVFLPPSDALDSLLTSLGTATVTTGISLAELLRRPQVSYAALSGFDPERPELNAAQARRVEIEVKYAGYIKRQLVDAEKTEKMSGRRIPPDTDYTQIYGLRTEAVQKLTKIRPVDIGQASRISGVSPADIAVLLLRLSMKNGNRENDNG